MLETYFYEKYQQLYLQNLVSGNNSCKISFLTDVIYTKLKKGGKKTNILLKLHNLLTFAMLLYAITHLYDRCHHILKVSFQVIMTIHYHSQQKAFI